jgi:hypothetical protein
VKPTPISAHKNPTKTCRYTNKPLSKCRCKGGCEPTQVQSGEWIQPVRSNYGMSCCDCGLIHSMNFRIYKGKVQFRAYRVNKKGKRIV